MAGPSRTALRLIPFLWFLTTAFSVFAVILRYRRTGEITWYLIGAAAFTVTMGVAMLKRSRSADG